MPATIIELNGSGYAGLGLGWYIGPLQFYFLTDHIPLQYSMLTNDGDKFPISESLKDVNLMFGMNLIFGKKGFRNEPMIGAR
jgi:hypothetical protein